MTEVKREIMSRYRVDGIFINRWDGSGMCYCQHCQKNFKDATGLELPRTNDPQNPARHAYTGWRQQRLFDLWQLWDREVRKINPDSCVIPNTGGGASSSLDMARIGELAPTLFADRQARRGVTVPWANGKNAKEFRAALGRKPIVGIFSVGLEEPYRWKDSVQNAAEFQLWAADGVANDLRPWFTKFAGTIRDPRWLDPVAEIYQRYAKWEKYLRNEKPLARVAIVYSQQSSWFHGGPVEDHINGWYQALIEARIPFEMVHDRLLDLEHIKQFKTLILPNITCLSNAQCDQLRAAARSGISLIATHETSLYDESGKKRDNFALADLFAADYAGKTIPRMQNAYLALCKNPDPLLRGLENAPRIIHGVSRVEINPRGPFTSLPVTLIPSYPDLPMEKVYPREGNTGIPQILPRDLGNARLIYFPWDIDRTFWEVLCVDHFKLLRNAVDWATNEKPPVTVTGPGILDVTIWRQKNSITIHLVNLTNPMMMKGPIREFIPIGKQIVEINLTSNTKPKKVHLLAAEKISRPHVSRDILKVEVPSITDHEVIAIDL
ncbi:MAG TPA: beta-galactosidase trimerization domain-containing protein, partial [Verrucomicrobiae bacterium]